MLPLSVTWLAFVFGAVAIAAGIARGTTFGGSYDDYCPTPGNAPEGNIYACFRSNDGPPSLSRGVQKHSAIKSSRSSPRDFALVMTSSDQSMFRTNTHAVTIDADALGCVRYTVSPSARQDTWCTNQDPIVI
ncbi:hypothetical protein EX895_002005 [Sporisorium graminicola]|uniref:Secreted protein n=1 Tax=Sporisorium graminicola TaxID=280036 RepID=A0A4U7KXE3_9BASI|nr:hypothetical protein EX895_002005 [Sporisorium graminicola]TKY89474.1 hypothetical protein EX895_002005 [Sporisorium graminicola]